MRRVKLVVKLLIGTQCVKEYETESKPCENMTDAYPLFKAVKKELNKWKKIISF